MQIHFHVQYFSLVMPIFTITRSTAYSLQNIGSLTYKYTFWFSTIVGIRSFMQKRRRKILKSTFSTGYYANYQGKFIVWYVSCYCPHHVPYVSNRYFIFNQLKKINSVQDYPFSLNFEHLTKYMKKKYNNRTKFEDRCRKHIFDKCIHFSSCLVI